MVGNNKIEMTNTNDLQVESLYSEQASEPRVQTQTTYRTPLGASEYFLCLALQFVNFLLILLTVSILTDSIDL